MKPEESGTKFSNFAAPKVYYPAFLNIEEKKVVVVGGGKVAERKILSLIKVCSDIEVISPDLTKRLEKEKQEGRIKHVPRRYKKGDLKNAFLVIAASDCPSINEQVSKDGRCLVNVVDTPGLCNFIVPSVMNRGLLTIAISTSGVSPALAGLIRNELKKLYGPEFKDYLNFLRKIRRKALAVIQDRKKRGEFLKAVSSEKMVRLLRKKGIIEVERAVVRLFKRATSK